MRDKRTILGLTFVPWLIARKAIAAIERCDGTTLYAMTDSEEIAQFNLTPEALTTICRQFFGKPGTFEGRLLNLNYGRTHPLQVRSARVLFVDKRTGLPLFRQNLPDGKVLNLSVSISVVKTRGRWCLMTTDTLSSLLCNTWLIDRETLRLYTERCNLLRRVGIKGYRNSSGEVQRL